MTLLRSYKGGAQGILPGPYCRAGGGLPPPVEPSFVSEWNTNNTSAGSSASNQVKLPLPSNGTYNFTVTNWGDGASDVITAWDQAEVTHTYAVPGIYTITIAGDIDGFAFTNTGDKLKILDISSWGALKVGNNGGYFYGCSNLNVTALDSPNLSSTTDMTDMFRDATSFNGAIGSWDVSTVMFMTRTFMNAASFNQPIGLWNVGNVTHTGSMFRDATSFNQDIGLWNVGNVQFMLAMFWGATSFNQPIGLWNVSNVLTMEHTFRDATSFNQDIGLWNVGNVTQTNNMFWNATSFNQPIGLWNVGNVQFMGSMFRGATSFNQDIGSLNVSNVTQMGNMFSGVTLSTPNYDALLIGWDGLPSLQNNVPFSGGNSQYSAGAAASARSNIISTFSWIITDGGPA